MDNHAYWQGQIRISLVQFGASLMTATKRSSQVPLHEYDRASGERIHHRDVTEAGKEIKPDAIVKGFETGKNDIIYLEDDEIRKLKLPSSDVLEIDSFVERTDIPTYRIERPYFVMPEGKNAGEIYQVIHQALVKSNKAGIGQLTIRGREELCALIAVGQGLMLQTLRYDSELISPESAFKDLKSYKPKSDYSRLAEQLIKQNSAALQLGHYHDRYHEALLKLVEAKKHHQRPTKQKSTAKPAKVSNFMDALKKSLKQKDVAERSANNNKKPHKAA